MAFGKLALVEITAMTGGIAVAIITALLGAGYWALVYMQLGNALCMAIGVWLACNWRPGLPKRRTGVKPMLAFGGHLTGFHFVNYFARNADNILIGRFNGSDALGFYSKAYQVVYMPIIVVRAPINAVAIPSLSRLQNDPERFRRCYGRIVFFMALFSMPLMAFCVMFSDDLILLFLGYQWLPMKGIFQVLAIAGFIQAVAGTKGAILIATGKAKLYLKLGSIMAIVTLIAFSIGVVWGAIGVAVAYTIALYAIQYPLFCISFRYSQITFRDLFWNFFYVALISCLSASCAKVFVMFVPKLNKLPVLWGSLAMVGLFFGLFMSIPHTRKQLKENVGLIFKELSARGK